MEINLIYKAENHILNISDTVSLDTLYNSVQGLFE